MDWYCNLTKDESISQGDLIQNCPKFFPKQSLPLDINDNIEIEFGLVFTNAVIMSQSCDLENNNIDYVLLCEVFPFEDWINQKFDITNPKKKDEKKNEIKKGKRPRYHILENPKKINEDLNIDISDNMIVDFNYAFSMEINNLKELVQRGNNRIRLLPPYREHLSQAFARFFMRVGLPQDIQ